MSATSLPGRPYPPEDRRLKALGLAFLGVAGATVAWLVPQAADQWPPSAERALPFLLGALLAVNLCAIGGLLLAAGLGATRSWRPTGRRRALILAVVAANLLVPLLWLGLVFSEPETEAMMAVEGWDLVLAVAAYAVAWLAWRLWRRSRRHVAESAEAAMARDPRPPVLYLRSFKDDGDANLGMASSAWSRRVVNAVQLSSVEEELAAVLHGIGPVVAIGRPGEPLPELGAARLYVSHDAWQQAVGNLMRQAGLVVVRVGASPGVLWEVDQALTHVPRDRLVLAMIGNVPPVPEIVDRLSAALGAPLSQALPDAWPEPRRRTWRDLFWQDPRRRLGALVCFDPAGRARAVPIRMWPLPWRDALASLFFRQAAGPLRAAWREVFAIEGRALGDEARLRSRPIAVGLALLVGWTGAHWFYLGRTRRGWLYMASVPLLLAPIFLSWADAIRFLWIDRAQFEAQFVDVTPRGTPCSRTT